MAIINVPTQRRQRVPSKGELFAKSMAPYLQSISQMLLQRKMQQQDWEKRFETQATEEEKRRAQELIASGQYEPYQKEKMGMRGAGGQPQTPAFTFGRAGIQLQRKPFTPKIIPIKDLPNHKMVETSPGKFSVTKMDTPSALERKINTLVAARGHLGPNELEDAIFGKPQYDLIENSDTGTQDYLRKGNKIPEGWRVIRTPAATVNIAQAPSPTERMNIASGRASIDALNNIRKLFDTAYVGQVKGRIGKVKDFFGVSPQAQSEFNAATAAFKNAIIKEITGAQMSEKEAHRILKQVPDVTDQPTVWMAKWKQSKENLERLQQRRLQILEQSGLKVPQTKTITKKVELPSVIQTTSEAVAWLMKKHNMTKQDAINWLIEQQVNEITR